MDVGQHWPEIIRTVTAGQKTCLHSAIATVSRDGLPNIAPIGTVFLRETVSGYFFDHHHGHGAKSSTEFCYLPSGGKCLKGVLARIISEGTLFRGSGVRLYGTAGPLRAATPAEITAVYHRIGLMRRLPGGR